MEIKRCIKETFSVIGKEGSTDDGAGVIQRLWNEANSHFAEIEHLAFFNRGRRQYQSSSGRSGYTKSITKEK